MSNPLGAILAGLAGGASTLGTAIDDREKLNDQKKKEAIAQAIQMIALKDTYGGSDVPEGMTNEQALAQGSVNDLNQLKAPGMQVTGTSNPLMPGVKGPSYTDQRDEQQSWGQPSVVQVGDQRLLLNPSMGKEARSERRAEQIQSRKDADAQKRDAMKSLLDWQRQLGLEQYKLQNAPPANPVIANTAEGVYALTHGGKDRQRLGSPVVPPANMQMTVQAGTEGKPAQAVKFNPRTGQVATEALPDVSKGASIGKGLNAQSAAQVARTFGGLAEMDNGRQFMDKYEADLDRGYDDNGKPVSLEGVAPVLKQMLGGLGTDVAHPVLGVPAFAALATADPRLARYLRYGMTFGEGEGLIANRPSDFRQKISQFLSTARAGMGPGSYSDIKSRRDVITEAVKAAMQTSVPEASKAVGAAIDNVHKLAALRAAWDEAKAKHGEELTTKELGPRP